MSLDATNDDALRGLATAYEKLNRPEDAEKTYQKAIDLRPQYWASCAWLRSYYFRHARYDDAARIFSEWIALTADSCQGYNNLGAVYLKQGRYGEAIPQFRRSVDINPGADAFGNLATVFFYQGNFAEAAHQYKLAMEVGGEASDNYSLPGNLAEAYYWTPGNREQAKELYRQAISRAEKSLQVNSREGSVLSSLALYHAMLSDRQEANSYLQHALQLAPGDPEVRLNAAKIRKDSWRSSVDLPEAQASWLGPPAVGDFCPKNLVQQESTGGRYDSARGGE